MSDIDNIALKQLETAIKSNVKTDEKKPTILYGTTALNNEGALCVKLDGSDILTPASSVVGVAEGQKVTVTIENHRAIITGCLSKTFTYGNDETGNGITWDGRNLFVNGNGVFSGDIVANANSNTKASIGSVSTPKYWDMNSQNYSQHSGTGFKVDGEDRDIYLFQDDETLKNIIYSEEALKLLAIHGEFKAGETQDTDMFDSTSSRLRIGRMHSNGTYAGTSFKGITVGDEGEKDVKVYGTLGTTGAIYAYGKTSNTSGSGVVIGDGTIQLQRTASSYPTIVFRNSGGTKQLNLLVNESDLNNQGASSVNIYLRPTVDSKATPTLITRRIECGDTIDIRGVYAGHITSSGKRLDFFVPIRDMNTTNFGLPSQITLMTLYIRHVNGGYAYCQTASSTFRYFNGINIPADMGYTCNYYPNGIRFSLSANNSSYGTFYRTAATTSAIPNNSPVSVELTTGVIKIPYAIG